MTEPRNEPHLTQNDIFTALTSIIARIDQIDAACGESFPLYSPGLEDCWIVSRGGSWMGGFWSGCWWLRARVTGSEADKHKASEICLRLASKTTSATLYRSMIFWYGAALGDLWFRDGNARQLATQSVAALAAAFDPDMHCVPLGTDLGGGDNGHRLITIDPLAPTIALLGRAEYGGKDALARQQLETTLEACRTDAGAYHAQAVYKHGRFRPTDQAGLWSRGQAWAMLGLCKAASLWGDPFLDYARAACDYWLKSRPEPFPPSRLDGPSNAFDPSASLIAALAMLSLTKLVPEENRWFDAARHRIAAIVHSRHFTGLRDGESGVASGIFSGACYRTRPDRELLVESVWSSFFLMAALCILAGIIEPTDC